MSEHLRHIPGEWLGMYRDGELDEARREQVRAHVRTCAMCRQELAQLQRLSAELAADRPQMASLPAPAAFWDSVQARLPERAAPGFSPARWLPGLGLLLVHGLLQLAAVASLVLAFAAGQLGWLAGVSDWLDRAALDWLVGWPAWLLPDQWTVLGWSLFLFVASASLVILYLAWLAYEWRYHRHAAVSVSA